VLGWAPKYDNVQDIIKTAWQWHQSHPKGYDDRHND
ncbi:UDP-glucose 4-epimerase GalE, partial [Leuconostoc falkenbergense]|nr:UDP-glucose 4-epimerase GalE [Leuconostoc falkenbergense]